MLNSSIFFSLFLRIILPHLVVVLVTLIKSRPMLCNAFVESSSFWMKSPKMFFLSISESSFRGRALSRRLSGVPESSPEADEHLSRAPHRPPESFRLRTVSEPDDRQPTVLRNRTSVPGHQGLVPERARQESPPEKFGRIPVARFSILPTRSRSSRG